MMTTGKKTSMRLRRYELIEKIRRFMYRVEIGGSSGQASRRPYFGCCRGGFLSGFFDVNLSQSRRAHNQQVEAFEKG